MTTHEHDTEISPEAVFPPENMAYDTPPSGFVPGTTYDPETPVEDLTTAEWLQWAYDNGMPFWAIKQNLFYRTPATVSGIEPSTAAIGDPSFTLYVTGTNFHAGSVIVFAGQDENTTLLEDGRLQTGVNMGFWHGADTVPVSVRNGPGGALSEPVDFTFTAAPEAVRDADPDYAEDDERDDEGRPAKKAKKKK